MTASKDKLACCNKSMFTTEILPAELLQSAKKLYETKVVKIIYRSASRTKEWVDLQNYLKKKQSPALPVLAHHMILYVWYGRSTFFYASSFFFFFSFLHRIFYNRMQSTTKLAVLLKCSNLINLLTFSLIEQQILLYLFGFSRTDQQQKVFEDEPIWSMSYFTMHSKNPSNSWTFAFKVHHISQYNFKQFLRMNTVVLLKSQSFLLLLFVLM